MIQLRTIQSWLLAAAMALHLPGCASSQLEATPEHPASPSAPQAPLPPVGEALANPQDPSAQQPDGDAANSPAGHSHGTAEAPSKSAPAADAAAHGGHQGHAPAANTAAPDDHASAAAAGEAERWTCPMHPEVIQSGPGKCPKCGMKLVPVTPKQ
jgi:hypothetical protein